MENQISILLVDDRLEEVKNILEVFHDHPLVSIDYYDKYSSLGSNDEDYIKFVEKYDLLILDILMDDKDQVPFTRFVSSIGCLKPFIAYTQLPKDDDFELAGHYVEIRKWVAQQGGIAVVSKEYSRNGLENSVQYDIVEHIMAFYWHTK